MGWYGMEIQPKGEIGMWHFQLLRNGSGHQVIFLCSIGYIWSIIFIFDAHKLKKKKFHDKIYHFSKFYWEHRSKTCQDQWLRISSLLSQLPLPAPWSHITYRGPLLGYRTMPPNAPSWKACKSLGLDYHSILQTGATCLSFHQILGVWKACIFLSIPPSAHRT